ncbi:MAG: hypothetical protein AMJ53_10800 [Gammaproteobacteria bacterium SG8_11]|nr:MAG: hypothetical protein AMJ53_10800 [Gammaproteobacteria bacterium SG8_11]
MNTNKKTTKFLKDTKIDVKIKLSVLWATLMFIYIYVDIFRFFQPGELENILAGKVWIFEITQTWALSAMIMMTIPSLMVFLSLALKAKWNRWTNIIMGILHIAIAIGNVIGETWAYYIFGGVVEVVLLSLIVWYAWKWPTQEV